MEKKAEVKKKKVKLPVIQEEAPLIEKKPIERKPRWGGPYEFTIGPQPWQYIVSIVFLLAFFGTIVVVATYKYI